MGLLKRTGGVHVLVVYGSIVGAIPKILETRLLFRIQSIPTKLFVFHFSSTHEKKNSFLRGKFWGKNWPITGDHSEYYLRNIQKKNFIIHLFLLFITIFPNYQWLGHGNVHRVVASFFCSPPKSAVGGGTGLLMWPRSENVMVHLDVGKNKNCT